MAKGSGRKVNRTELADLFGVSMPTIDSWVRAGCPVVQRGAGKGKAWIFDTADVARWREQKAGEDATGTTVVEESALKRRKLLADTLKIELELATAQGLVAPVEQMERNVSRAMAEISINMRNLPSRCVSLLIGETDERRFKSVMLAEIDLVLESMAELDVAADDPGEDESEVE